MQLIGNDLLLELGCEELPAWTQKRLATSLKQEVVTRFVAAEFEPAGGIESYYTPRRLIVQMYGLPSETATVPIESWGPTLAAAKDSHGEWSAGAQGFARKFGKDPSALETRVDENGKERLLHRGQKLGKVLLQCAPTLLTEAIDGWVKGSARVGRVMRWESGGDTFIRPVRWITTRLNSDPIPIEVFGVAAGVTSKGHQRNYSPPLPIDSASSYRDQMLNEGVDIDHSSRLQTIETQINEQLRTDEVLEKSEVAEVLEEIADLVEYPHAIACEFPQKYLKNRSEAISQSESDAHSEAIPPELIVQVLLSHQRFLPLRLTDQVHVLSGALSGRFLGVADGKNLSLETQDNIRMGYERVVLPRLEDASFYFRRDCKVSLHERSLALAGMAFHSKLGNWQSHSERVVKVIDSLKDKLHPLHDSGEVSGSEIKVCKEAALLMKADQLSETVQEFPKLEGILGAYLAQHEGFSAEICSAIREHHHPTSERKAQHSTAGNALLALADKSATLIGLAAATEFPKGSSDPMGLRRLSRCINSILRSQSWRVSYETLIESVAATLPKDLQVETDFTSKCVSFLLERATAHWEGDLPWQAAKKSEGLVIAELNRAALADFASEDWAMDLIESVKRATNITRKARTVKAWPQLDLEAGLTPLATEVDKELANAILLASKNFDTHTVRGDKMQALQSLSTLQGPIQRLFDTVRIADTDEPQLRDFRLGMLEIVSNLAREIGDLAVLGGSLKN